MKRSETEPSPRKRTKQSRLQPPRRAIIAKIRTLPPERLAEVEDFIDFLHQREDDRVLTRAATKLAEKVFERVWNNLEDAAYDRL